MPQKKSTRPAGARWLGAFRKLGRVLGIFLIVLVLLAAAAAVAVKVLVTPEALRAKIAAQLEETFHRPVRIDHVTVVLHQGIKVRGLVVEASPEFPGDIFLSCEFLVVKLKLKALLQRRIELDRVLLMAPRINLVRRSDGKWNLQDMLSRSKRKRPGLSLPTLDSAEEIDIERGMLRVRDLKNKVDLGFERFELQVRHFSPEEPFPMKVSFQNASRLAGKLVRAEVDFEGKVNLGGFDPAKGMISAEKLSAKIDGRSVSAVGTVTGLRTPKIDAKFFLPRLTTKDLSEYRSVPEGIDFPPSVWELRAAPVVKEVSTSAAVSVSTPVAVTRWKVDRLSAAAGGMKLAAFGSIDRENRTLYASVRAESLPLDKLGSVYGPWTKPRLEGEASGSMTFEGSWAEPRLDRLAMRLDGFSMSFWDDKRISRADIALAGAEGLRTFSLKAAKGTFVAFGNALSDLDLELKIRNGDMRVSKIGFTWNTSRIGLKGCVKRVKKPSEVFFTAEADQVRTDELYSTLENIIALRRKRKGLPAKSDEPWTAFKYSVPDAFPDLRGRLRIARGHSPNFDTQNIELVADLRDISKGLPNLNGHFRLGFGPGRVDNIPVVQKVHPVLNVGLLPFVEMQKLVKKSRLSPDTMIPKTLDFTRVYGEFGGSSGIVDVRYMHFDSNQFVSFTDGTMDFPNEKLKMSVLLRLPTTEGNLPYHMSDTKGRTAIAATLKDNLNSPTVEFILKKMEADAIEDALAEGLKKVRPFPSIDAELDCGWKD